MNLIQIQDQLKGLPTQAIMGYANGQNPEVPPYVALAELNRRKQMQSGAMAGQGGQKPTIKDQITQSTGLMGLQNAQQQQAMQQVARAPQQGPVPQGAPEGPVQGAPEGFAGGGAIAFAEGGDKGLDDAVYDPVTGALISGGDSDKTDLSLSEVLAKKVNPDYAPYRETKKPVGIASVASRPVRSAPSQVQQDQQTGLQAAIDQQQAKLPAPAVVAQGIAQGTPTQSAPKDLAATMQSTAAKMQPALVTAITEGLAKGQTIDEAINEAKRLMPVSKYQEMLANELAASRKQELERRKAPDSFVNNEGFMAALRGFAQADPRRPYGAAGAAYSDFNQKQIAQRAAEDTAYRQGLAGLGKSEEDRNTKLVDYGIGRLGAAASAKNNAITAGTQMTDAAMRQAQADKNHQAQMAQIAESAKDRAQRASDALAARGDAAKAAQVQALLKQDETGLAKIETEYPTMLRSSPTQLAGYNDAIAAHRSRMAKAAKALDVPGYEASNVPPMGGKALKYNPATKKIE